MQDLCHVIKVELELDNWIADTWPKNSNTLWAVEEKELRRQANTPSGDVTIILSTLWMSSCTNWSTDCSVELPTNAIWNIWSWWCRLFVGTFCSYLHRKWQSGWVFFLLVQCLHRSHSPFNSIECFLIKNIIYRIYLFFHTNSTD